MFLEQQGLCLCGTEKLYFKIYEIVGKKVLVKKDFFKNNKNVPTSKFSALI